MPATNPIFDDPNTGIFTRIGQCNKILTSVNTYRGTTLPGVVNTLNALFSTADQSIPGSLYSAMSGSQSGVAAILSQIQTIAQASLMTAYNQDVPSGTSLSAALAWLVAKMNATSDTVKKATVSATSTAGGSNSGSAQVLVSTLRNDGLSLEQSFVESIIGTITQDSQTSGTTIGQEVFTFSGQVNQTDTLNWLWPSGSGSKFTVTCVDPLNQSLIGGNSNWLANGSFETFTTSNVPDNWSINVGTPGTTLLKDIGTYADGASSYKFHGDGATYHSIYQALRLVGTPIIQPLTVYCANMWYNQPTVAGTAVLKLSLVDGSGTVINDAQGTPNSVTVTLSSKSNNTWYPLGAFFRTPKVLPSAVSLQIQIVTAPLSNTENLFIDRVGFTTPVNAYPGGPYVCAFSGTPSSKLILGDKYTLAVSNNYGGVLQKACDRLFGMRALNLILPSSASPTISDSLG